jgi:hypothetical protein
LSLSPNSMAGSGPLGFTLKAMPVSVAPGAARLLYCVSA